MKTSVYIPDDLARDAKRHKIPISGVLQSALREAVALAEGSGTVKLAVTFNGITKTVSFPARVAKLAAGEHIWNPLGDHYE